MIDTGKSRTRCFLKPESEPRPGSTHPGSKIATGTGRVRATCQVFTQASIQAGTLLTFVLNLWASNLTFGYQLFEFLFFHTIYIHLLRSQQDTATVAKQDFFFVFFYSLRVFIKE